MNALMAIALTTIDLTTIDLTTMAPTMMAMATESPVEHQSKCHIRCTGPSCRGSDE